MSYVGDIHLGDTIDIKFTTRQISGAPFTLSGGVISAYVGNSTTEITAGITLTADFDSRTGLNNVRVVASGGNGFAAGTNIQLVITTGTVNSVSVVGEVIGEFSIDARTANVAFWNGGAVPAPAQTGVPIVDLKYILGTVITEGAAGRVAAAFIKFFNIAASTLTTAGVDQTGDSFARLGAPVGASTSADIAGVQADTDNIQTRIPAALTGGKMESNVGSVTAGVIAAASFAANALDAVWSTAVRALTDKANFTLSAAYDPAKTAAQAGDAMTLTAGERTAVANSQFDQANGIETGLTMRQAMRLDASAVAGKGSGGGTATMTYRNAVADSKDRIVATVDAVGNRTAITYDVS